MTEKKQYKSETKRQFKPETGERRLERLSKFISMILRHKPEVIGITLLKSKVVVTWIGKHKILKLHH